jgi:hypothetical protein
MNSRFRGLLLVVSLVVLGAISCLLAAQQVSQPQQVPSPGTVAGSTSSQGIGRVSGFPYSADEVTVTTQTLADGTKITRRHLVKVYRDSAGRERREWFKPGVESVQQNDLPLSVNIIDPLAGAAYFLNSRSRTAQKSDIRKPTPPPPAQTTGASAKLTPAPPVRPRPLREDLGTQVIEGLEATGERITRTIPAGAEGNDQPIQITEEIWLSAKPHLVLLRTTNDPRHGETVMRLTNLVLDEPPAELFQVPADYTVVELQPVTKPEPPSD